jgi:hypothetical protein
MHKALNSILSTPKQLKGSKIISNFSIEILKGRRAWNEVFQTLEDSNYKPSLLYPAKLSFTIEG